ncbi:uncharacterized protein F4812DRAFT_353003 [Daldinia caldariorum]|uniref:uncharacterized protein n=1 Tax=Daldinia caldariorum TaxID=326644 RepID=UPI0020083C4C|nr:uncharacterized protein F4812DRAFT_353003 [Daldinia caldariorum]KAI1468963.1 hypothetical protein F4812DRAFT_353003 [Daldinia caldariorum]
MTRLSYFCLQLALFHFFRATFAISSHCYYPNQQEAEGDSPCNPNADSSACCGRGIGTICLSNGLCQGPNGAVIRGSCSDKYWDSGNCANYCLGASLGGTDLVSCANVTKDDTSYCCNGAENCCDSGDGRFSVGPHNPTTSATWNAVSTKFILVGITSTSSSTRTASSIPTASLTRESTTSPPGSTTANSTISGELPNDIPTSTNIVSQPESTFNLNQGTATSSDLSDGAKAGIGIGVAIGTLLIVGLIYALWRLKKMKNRLAKDQPGNQNNQAPTFPTSEVLMPPNNVNMTSALPPKSQSQISELYGHDNHLHELPTEST